MIANEPSPQPESLDPQYRAVFAEALFLKVKHRTLGDQLAAVMKVADLTRERVFFAKMGVNPIDARGLRVRLDGLAECVARVGDISAPLPPLDSELIDGTRLKLDVAYNYCESVRRASQERLRSLQDTFIKRFARRFAARPSADFRHVYWFGTEHGFSPTQAHVVEVLYDEWRARRGPLSEKAIAERARLNADSFRMQATFKDSDAMGTMIVSPAKGTWALQEPVPTADDLLLPGGGQIATEADIDLLKSPPPDDDLPPDAGEN